MCVGVMGEKRVWRWKCGWWVELCGCGWCGGGGEGWEEVNGAGERGVWMKHMRHRAQMSMMVVVWMRKSRNRGTLCGKCDDLSRPAGARRTALAPC